MKKAGIGKFHRLKKNLVSCGFTQKLIMKIYLTSAQKDLKLFVKFAVVLASCLLLTHGISRDVMKNRDN